LAGGPFVILRIVSTGTDKQIEKVRVTCGQTKRVAGPTVADGQSTDDDVRLGREVDAGADVGDRDGRLGCRTYKAEDLRYGRRAVIVCAYYENITRPGGIDVGNSTVKSVRLKIRLVLKI